MEEVELPPFNYKLAKQRGESFLYQNFESVRSVGIFPFETKKVLRGELDDYCHATFSAIRTLSMLSLQPTLLRDFYGIAKVLAYHATMGAMGTPAVRVILDKLRRPIVWHLFHSKRILDRFVEEFNRAWGELGMGLLEEIEVDKERKTLRVVLESTLPFSVGPLCFLQLGGLAGVYEALFGVDCDGEHTSCIAAGDERCEFRLWLHRGERPVELHQLSREAYREATDQAIEMSLGLRESSRGKVRGEVHLSVDQSLNYMILSVSRGHRVLSHYSGVRVGEIICSHLKPLDAFECVEKLADYFRKLGIGILEAEYSPELLRVKLRESVYATGVRPIGVGLCRFIAGILQGALTKVTRFGWEVREAECIALRKGVDLCSFDCVPSEEEEWRKMVLG